ncbi:MAG: xanthine dehydrogenase family protein subunit M [Myxococcales bacterium]|nr:xanthine dehydrogenase family protein subunit M [Myxococcales bacterium]
MKPAPFTYYRPDSVAETVELLGAHGDDGKLLAGGQSLIPMMNLRLAQPAVLIDLGGVTELAGIRRNGALEIGATTRQAAALVSSEVAEAAPLLQRALGFVGHPANRNRGTVGGSLAHADPAAELPAVALALGASFSIRGPSGTRSVAADDFFKSYLTTAVSPDEFLADVVFPSVRPEHNRAGFCEVSRRHGDFALVGAAVSISLSSRGDVEEARVALMGVADRAVRIHEAESALLGHRLEEAALPREIGAIAARELDPPFDQQASSQYRKDVAAVVVERALHACRDETAAREGM